VDRQMVTVDGIETSYLDSGPDDREVVVLIHGAGIGMDGSSWFPAADALRSSFRVVALDLLGYGGTRKAIFFDRSATDQRLAHVGAFCRELGIDAATFVGHSMGGGLVLAGAIAGTLPITHAVSLAGPGGMMLDRKAMGAVQTQEPDRDWARRACEVGVANPSDEMIDQRLERAQAPDHLAAMAAVGQLNRLHPRPADYEERYLAGLRRVTQPTLLVAGGDDPFADPRWVEVLGSALPNGRTLVVDGARHEPHVSHPGLVMGAISDLCMQDATTGS